MVCSKTFLAIPPGATIEEILECRNITQKEFALRMGLTEKYISKLINGKIHLTPEVSEKLEKVLNVDAHFWNNLEAIYRETLVKVKNENTLKSR